MSANIATARRIPTAESDKKSPSEHLSLEAAAPFFWTEHGARLKCGHATLTFVSVIYCPLTDQFEELAMRLSLLAATCLLVVACDQQTSTQSTPNTAAPAATTPASVSTPNYALCEEDLKRFCQGIAPGEGRLVNCLKENKEEISQPCRELWKF